MTTLVSVTGVTRIYNQLDNPTTALCDVSLEVRAAEMVAICGPSGCGKSTLLHLLGAMDRPTEGSIILGGTDLGEIDEGRRIDIRRTQIGFVFQAFHLLPTLNVLENVTLPLDLEGVALSESHRRATDLLERVGLSHRVKHFPSQLSGGEMQRAAIARAVIHEPLLLLADEPTGSLDSTNGAQIFDLLAELNSTFGQTVVVATHSHSAAQKMHRVVHMRDGQVEHIEQNDDLPKIV
jgi:putative ABC transport system ATP-binding protein